jgi:hypothetical protein
MIEVLLYLVGAFSLVAIAFSTYTVVLIRRGKLPAAEPEVSVPGSVVDAAYDEIDRATEEGGPGIVFGLPPRHQPEAPPVPLSRQGQVEVDTHPCDYLSGVTPPRFRPGEAEGICWHRDKNQRGRVCFWSPSSAANCPWFTARVRPTRVKLKKIEGGKKSA